MAVNEEKVHVDRGKMCAYDVEYIVQLNKLKLHGRFNEMLHL